MWWKYIPKQSTLEQHGFEQSCLILQTHGLQHAKLPFPSQPAGAYSDSCPLSQWSNHLNHLNLCHPLLLLPSIFPSIKVFSNESALCIRWPKCWSFTTSPSRLIRSPGSPRRRKESGALEVELGVWNSQGRGKDKHFLSTFVNLSHIKWLFL